MRFNKGALKVSAAYLAFAMLMLTWSYFTADFKSAYMYRQIAIIPATASFGIFRLFHLLIVHPWMNSILFFVPLSALIVYLIGWAISAAVNIGHALANKLNEDRSNSS